MNNIQEIITNMATIITSGGVIVAFALKMGKKILDKSLQPFNDKIEKMDKLRIEQHEETKEEIAKLREELNKNSLNTMKNTICNENIPISERITTGKEYIDKGGNGAVKIYVHQLEQEYEESIKKKTKH